MSLRAQQDQHGYEKRRGNALTLQAIINDNRDASENNQLSNDLHTDKVEQHSSDDQLDDEICCHRYAHGRETGRDSSGNGKGNVGIVDRVGAARNARKNAGSRRSSANDSQNKHVVDSADENEKGDQFPAGTSEIAQPLRNEYAPGNESDSETHQPAYAETHDPTCGENDEASEE